MIDIYWQIPHDSGRVEDSIEETEKFLLDLEKHNHYRGSLVYYHHDSLDPWIIASSIVQMTKSHVPLVAVQPYTMLPSTAATMIHSIAHIYNRKVDLNFITGSIPTDLEEVGNTLNKVERYDRLSEFAQIVRAMLTSNEPLTFNGKFYNYSNLKHRCAVPVEMMPDFYMPMQSASEKGVETVLKIADVVVTIPKNIAHFKDSFLTHFHNTALRICLKLQVLARPTYDEAIEEAKRTIANFRNNQIAKKVESKSNLLSDEEKDCYYPAIDVSGPWIVGSYEQVRLYLSKYVELGVDNLIIPNINKVEIVHCNEVFSGF